MGITEEFDLDAYITQVDLEKASDWVEWPLNFLFETLTKIIFYEQFISWVKIIYNDISACVGNNSFFSVFFKLSRSIKLFADGSYT